MPIVSIDQAVILIKAGDVVALPTETVYGLAADACQSESVEKIFKIKGRPSFNPLIVHVHNLEQAKKFVQFNEMAEELANKYWPGPLTLVLPRKEASDISPHTFAGLSTLAIRCPAHPIMQTIIAKLGCPLAAPSANPSSRISPTRAEHVLEDFDHQVSVVDGGPCRKGIESTIVDCTQNPPVILRHGALSAEELGIKNQHTHTNEITAPGQMLKHYAPAKPLRLNIKSVEDDEALLAFGPQYPKNAAVILNLSERGDLEEAAQHLFDYLHELDKAHVSAIAVMPIPNNGLGIAINDRLKRASYKE
jgi:L-threonylcarbamoyladenylate synthase